MADVQLQLCRMPHCDVSAYTAPSTARSFSLTHRPDYSLIHQEHRPSSQPQPRPKAPSESGRWAVGAVSQQFSTYPCGAAPHGSHQTASGHPSHPEACQGNPTGPHPPWELPLKETRLTGWASGSGCSGDSRSTRTGGVKGVCMGEWLVRVSRRLSRLLRGTVPKSRRSSSRRAGHSSVLGTLPRAQGTKLRHPRPCPESPMGRA